MLTIWVFVISSERRHTRCALVTGVQTCSSDLLWLLPGRYVRSPVAPGFCRAIHDLSHIFSSGLQKLYGLQKASGGWHRTENEHLPASGQIPVPLPTAKKNPVSSQRPALFPGHIPHPSWIGKASCRKNVCQYV